MSASGPSGPLVWHMLSFVALVAVVVVVKTQFSLGSGLMLVKSCQQIVRYARLIGNAYYFYIIDNLFPQMNGKLDIYPRNSCLVAV